MNNLNYNFKKVGKEDQFKLKQMERNDKRKEVH